MLYLPTFLPTYDGIRAGELFLPNLDNDKSCHENASSYLAEHGTERLFNLIYCKFLLL